jgi:hypothetical protein
MGSPLIQALRYFSSHDTLAIPTGDQSRERVFFHFKYVPYNQIGMKEKGI